MIQYLMPTGGETVEDAPYSTGRELTGSLRVALLANSFPGSSDFLDTVAEALEIRGHHGSRLRFEKGGIRDSTEMLTERRLDEIAEASEVVIAAYGHCGSCTAALVRDCVRLARRGLAVVAFVTEVFEETATLIARAEGMSSVPRVILPHPLASLDASERAVIAQAYVDQALTALRGDSA